MKKPIIAITMGDAAGVGPEIIVKALACNPDLYDLCHPFVIGDFGRLSQAVKIADLSLQVRLIDSLEQAQFRPGIIDCFCLGLIPSDLPWGEVSKAAGEGAFRYLEKAVELSCNQEVDAICTAPLNKEALNLAGHCFPGHTEILAHLTGTEDFSMMLATPEMKVLHLTTHVGLLDAVSHITPERAYRVIRLAHDSLSGNEKKQPHIAICGINPHAGEGGLFGYREEEEKILPAIERAVQEGISVSGPYPSDTIFLRARKREFDVVIACYHDQGHIAVKTMGIDDGVNVTLGLKKGVIRTSVDHGTAFDIAGQNKADAYNMAVALRMALDFV